MRLIWMREPLRCYSSRFVVVYVSSWIMSILPCSVWTNLSRHSRLLIRLRNVFGLAVDTTLQCFLACEALRYVLHCQILISPLSTDFTSNLPQGDVTAGWLCSGINEQVAPWLYSLLPNPLRPIWDVLRIKNSALNTSYLSCMYFLWFLWKLRSGWTSPSRSVRKMMIYDDWDRRNWPSSRVICMSRIESLESLLQQFQTYSFQVPSATCEDQVSRVNQTAPFSASKGALGSAELPQNPVRSAKQLTGCRFSTVLRRLSFLLKQVTYQCSTTTAISPLHSRSRVLLRAGGVSARSLSGIESGGTGFMMFHDRPVQAVHARLHIICNLILVP